MSDLAGELIDGRYHLEKLLAAGGMASIYVAMDTRLDRKVAVKIMHPHLAQNEEFVSRFIREAKATAALSHPNIVGIQDQGWNEGGAPAVFIVMEYIDGSTLRDYLLERGSLSLEEVLKFIIPVTSALAEAHRIGIIHRDLKPENILISKDGRVKIADFGLARGSVLGATQTAESSVVLGSVSYLSPEQVERGISDARSDVYSLGITLFELLTGVKPFDGDSPITIAYRHVNETVPSIHTLKPQLNPEIGRIIAKATERNPDKRYSTAAALMEDLQALQITLDPSKRQMSLQLDLPPAPEKNKKSKSRRTEINKGIVRIGDQIIERAKNLTGPVEKLNRDINRESTTMSVRNGKKKTSSRVKRNRAIAAAILLSLIGGSYYYFGPAKQIVLPSVVGLTQTDAKASINALGLKVDITSEDFSEEVDKGLVLTSIPGGGGRIGKDGTVHLVISKGKERISIPNVSGMTQDAATAAIINSGLKVGNVTSIFSNVAKDMVADTNPPIGTPSKRNAVIDLIISKGIEQVALTDYTNKSSDQAVNELTDAGFKVKVAYAYSETVPQGAVKRQDPAGTASINKGSEVLIVVSRGSEFTFVPNVYALTKSAAVTAIENVQLKAVVKTIGTKPSKKVTGISPKVGTKVRKGTVVTITLS